MWALILSQLTVIYMACVECIQISFRCLKKLCGTKKLAVFSRMIELSG